MAQCFERSQGGCIASFDAEFLEDDADVLFHGGFAIAQDAGDLRVGFSLCHPQQDFGFARRKFEGIAQGFRGTEVGVESTA